MRQETDVGEVWVYYSNHSTTAFGVGGGKHPTVTSVVPAARSPNFHYNIDKHSQISNPTNTINIL